MSIYRSGRHISYNDLHEFEPTGSRVMDKDQGGPVDWSGARKAIPVTRLLPTTSTWLATLPPHVRPRLLPRYFARIANYLCATWNDPDAFDRYARDLVIDRRAGRRQGFPVPIIEELNALFDHYSRLHPRIRWQIERRRR